MRGSLHLPLLILFLAASPVVAVPAIDPASPQWERALKGRVVGPDNKPVAGASVRCDHVRTPGEGLISGATSVQTDAEGRFVLYPAGDHPFNGRLNGIDLHGDLPERPREHGDLVPLNSTYHITVDVPADEHFFVHHGDYRNTDLVTIRLQRPEKKRTFRYESPAGGFMTDEQLQGLYLYYSPSAISQNEHLDAKYSRGGFLAAGTYRAQVQRISFETVTVTAESPDELIFRLPPPITFRGRVVDAATGAPMAGVFVLGLESTGEFSLARLEHEQWDAMEKIAGDPAADDPALKPIRDSFGFTKILRTDAQGNYAFLQTPAMGQTYGLVVFARDRLPLLQRLYETKPNADHVAAMGDIELFPAARVKTQIHFNPQADGPRSSAPSVMPRWEFDPEAKQPEWFAKMKKIDGGVRQFACDHWLPIKSSATIFVPADVSLRLRLDVPYDDRWSPKEPDTLLKLAAGETKEIAAISFEPSLEVKVRVIDEAGRPIEGAPVRRLDAAQNVWSVVRNTDAQGDVTFFIRPKSTGQFGIIDLPGLQGGNLPGNLTLRYQVGDSVEKGAPMLMKMTAEQIRKLKGAKPVGDV